MDGARTPETPTNAGTLYDRYLAECLAGRAESPAVFCERHGAADATLFARLEALYRVVATPGAAPAPGPPRLPPEEGLPVERVGEFRLLRHLDKGGMGLVFLAEQESLGRLVAVKLIRPELRASASAVERFRREARAAARLRHPNIVPIHAFGEEAGQLYLAMEFVPGRTLDAILAEARAAGQAIAPPRAAAWARDLARALHAAHEEGIVHRDVKPSNVLVGPDDRPMLLDFGIARDETIEGPKLTTTFAGTPHYAAPEQLLSRDADRRSDVYGLGATLYECLVGRTPFAGETLGDLVAKSAAAEPVSPRRQDGRIPRDLEIITMKALDRDPARRYPTAAAFADDLQALLEFRPISARGAGPLVRARRWCRRRPAAAATLATVALALAAGLVLLVAQHRAAAERTRREARDLVAEARARLDDYRTSRGATAGLEREVSRLVRDMGARFTTAEEDRLLQEKEDGVLAARRTREAAAYGILDLVRQAERLDPLVAGTEEVRAELYAEKWREARDAGDPVAERLYREMVAQRRDRLRASPLDTVRLEITSEPPGAEVHLFRCADLADVVPGGEHRLVPVPVHGTDPAIAPGAWALRVVRGAGALRPDDLILRLFGLPVQGTLFAAEGETIWRVDSVDGAHVGEAHDIEAAAGWKRIALENPADGTRAEVEPDRFPALRLLSPADLARRGGVPATVYRGAPLEATLPPGLDVRATAAALPLSARSLVGRTPVAVDPEPGRVLFLLRAEGFESRRLAFTLGDGPLGPLLSVPLDPDGTTPAGFVRLVTPHPSPVFIMEREVTCEEYLEFLSDPDVLARTVAQPRLFPRSGANQHEGGFWPRDASGRHRLPGEWRPDWPVIGISWEDATEYAAWRTARARGEGRRDRYALPTGAEWVFACGGWSARNYPFGDRFRPKWVKCCFARKQAAPEPILRFPIDESPLGVFDVCGGAREWLDDWYDEGRRMRRLGGGSWATGDPELLKVWGIGAETDDVSGENGFRLVLRRDRE